MQSAELANVTGNHCQDQSFHRIESRSTAHHEDWLKVLFSMIQSLVNAGPQPADISRWRKNVCNLLLYREIWFVSTCHSRQGNSCVRGPLRSRSHLDSHWIRTVGVSTTVSGSRVFVSLAHGPRWLFLLPRHRKAISAAANQKPFCK